MDRRVLLTLGIAAATALGSVLLFRPEEEERAGFAPGALAFPGIEARLAEAARLEIRRGDAGLNLLRVGDEWLIAEMHAFRARPQLVREALAGLAELRLVEERTADPALLPRLGLDDASAVSLRVLDTRGGTIAELLLGRRRVRTQGGVPETISVRRPGDARSWLAEGRLAVEPDAQLWVDRDVADIPPERLRRVEVSRVGEPPLLLARDPGGAVLLRVEEPAGTAADRTALDEVGRAFEALTFVEVRPEAEAAGEALGEARFVLDTGTAVSARAILAEGRLWLVLAAEGADAEAARWAERWRGWAFQVGAWKEQAILPRLEDLTPR